MFNNGEFMDATIFARVTESEDELMDLRIRPAAILGLERDCFAQEVAVARQTSASGNCS